MASTAVSSATVYAPSSTGPVFDQVHHGRDQALGHGRLARRRVRRAPARVTLSSLMHSPPPAHHVPPGRLLAALRRGPRRRCATASR